MHDLDNVNVSLILIKKEDNCPKTYSNQIIFLFQVYALQEITMKLICLPRELYLMQVL